jgi:uncharacterized protein YjbJ (UPF0337 family)
MIEDVLKGQWNQLKGRVRQQWGRLTDDDVSQIKGERDILIGKIQEHYGRTRIEAEAELAGWLSGQRDQTNTTP